MSRYLTISVIGDTASRKTELLYKYTGCYKTARYRDYLMPKFQDNIQRIIVDHVRYLIHFVDIETDDAYQILRRNAYQKSDCIILCYSIGIKETFDNLQKKWCLEVRKYAPFTPIILVGCDPEYRNINSRHETVSIEQGYNFKLLIGAYDFIECSIEKSIGIHDVFIAAVRSTYRRYRRL